MFRPKNCKKCGGKMKAQAGKIMMPQLPAITDADYLPVQEEEKRREFDRIQQGILAGIIEPPRADSPDNQLTAQQYYDSVNSIPQSQVQYKNNMTPQSIGIAMQAVRTGLGEVGNILERGRQNDWDAYQQPSHIMNPMPTTDYQPNPYRLYSKYGGSLKQYQKGGMNPLQGYNNSMAVSAANQPKPRYDLMATKTGLSPGTDSLFYKVDFQHMLDNEKYALKSYADFQKYPISPNMSEKAWAMTHNQYNAYKDVEDQRYKGAAKALTVRPEVSVNPNRQQGGPTYASQYGDKAEAMMLADRKKIRGILARINDPNAETAYGALNINEPILKFVGDTPPPNPIPLATSLPPGITPNMVENTTEGYGYYHPQEGTFIKVNPQAVFPASAAIQKAAPIAPTNLMAKLRYGGLKHAKYFVPILL